MFKINTFIFKKALVKIPLEVRLCEMQAACKHSNARLSLIKNNNKSF